MPRILDHHGLQARVRREERRLGYCERRLARLEARADRGAATNPRIELPGNHQYRHPNRKAGDRGQYRARSPELGGGDRLLGRLVERQKLRVGVSRRRKLEAGLPRPRRRGQVVIVEIPPGEPGILIGRSERRER